MTSNIQDISLDIYDSHTYEQIFSKQYDNGRKVRFTVTENAQEYDLTDKSVSFEMKKDDGTVVLKSCQIEGNQAIVTIDKNITVFFGNRIPYQIKIVDVANQTVITTVTGYMFIQESVVKQDDVESTSDFSSYADILLEISTKYEQSKTFADNAKTSETNAKKSETNASASASTATAKAADASESATKAKTSETNALISATNAKTSETNAKNSETNASSSATKAKASEEQSAINATASDNSQREALQSVSNARTAEANTLSHANEAKMAKDSASDYAKLAQSYANGSSGTRTNEETDNAKYYSDQAKSVSNSIPTYIKQIENAGDSQVSRINEALTNASVNFIVDIATGHLMYEGTNKLNFSVNNNGHLEWEVVSL